MQKISIVQLTHNNKSQIQVCLPTLLFVLNRPDVLEWIILDNGSADGSIGWLRQFARKHKKIRLIQSDKNMGCSGGRKRLYAEAKGDLILSMDSDVTITNQYFINYLLCGLNMPQVGIVGDHGCDIKTDWGNTENKTKDYVGYSHAVTGYCTMFKREIIDAGIEMDTTFGLYWLEDTFYCLEILYKLNLKSFVIPCGVQHNWSGTNKGNDKQEKWEYLVKTWKDKIKLQ